MCARNGIPTRGCSMYMTTFPCHNCAKHIIAAGIKKVTFIPFKGVGPHRFIDLFSMKSIRWYSRTRKTKDGHIIKWERQNANLRNPMALLNYIDMEQSAFKQYVKEITEITEEASENE